MLPLGSSLRSAAGAGASLFAVIDSTHWLLTLSCADRPGIVHQVTGAIVEAHGNITELQQFTSTESGRFFMRVQVQSGLDVYKRQGARCGASPATAASTKVRSAAFSPLRWGVPTAMK